MVCCLLWEKEFLRSNRSHLIFFFAFILPLLKLQEARVFDPENKVKMCLFHSQSVSQSASQSVSQSASQSLIEKQIEKLIEKQIENLLKRPMA